MPSVRLGSNRREVILRSPVCEFGTLAALWMFCHADLEAVILEVGLGGRLDAVNVFDADCAILPALLWITRTTWEMTSRPSVSKKQAFHVLIDRRFFPTRKYPNR